MPLAKKKLTDKKGEGGFDTKIFRIGFEKAVEMVFELLPPEKREEKRKELREKLKDTFCRDWI